MDPGKPWLQQPFLGHFQAAYAVLGLTMLDADLGLANPHDMSPRTQAQLEVLYMIMHGRTFLNNKSRVVVAVLGTGAGETLLIKG